jgi:archaellum component FlaC
MDMGLLWSGGLTVVLGIIGWALRSFLTEMQRIQILLNRTREEMAREYVTKAEVNTDIDRVMDRLDRLDEKLDRLMAR